MWQHIHATILKIEQDTVQECNKVSIFSNSFFKFSPHYHTVPFTIHSASLYISERVNISMYLNKGLNN